MQILRYVYRQEYVQIGRFKDIEVVKTLAKSLKTSLIEISVN